MYEIDTTSYQSKNFDERINEKNKPVAIAMITLHATGDNNAHRTTNYLCRSDVAKPVSAHYVIWKDGRIFQLVNDDKRAWTNGASVWKAFPDTNDVSINIELVNDDSGDDPYPIVQIDALTWLVEWKARQYNVLSENIVRHADIAPKRKVDPKGFPWKPWKDGLTLGRSRDFGGWGAWGSQYPLYDDQKMFAIPQFWLRHNQAFGEARSNEMWIDGIWCCRIFENGWITYDKASGKLHSNLRTGLAIADKS